MAHYSSMVGDITIEHAHTPSPSYTHTHTHSHYEVNLSAIWVPAVL